MYMSLSATQNATFLGSLGNVNFTGPLFKMEVLFQIVPYIAGTGVSLGVHPRGILYPKSSYTGAGSAAGWLVQAQAYYG